MNLSHDDDAKLDVVLGQTHHLLGEDGDSYAQRLVQAAKSLVLYRDGGRYHPMPGNNWMANTYEAALVVPEGLVPEFTNEVIARIWARLESVLQRYNRDDVTGLVIHAERPPLPDVSSDWRDGAAQAATEVEPTNQARREREHGGHPVRDGLVLTNRAETVVYDLLVDLQRDLHPQRTFAIAPLPGVRLRDEGVRTPDFLVIGNGSAVVIEVDDRSHYGTTRKADDANRDRHWGRCGVETLRISGEYTNEVEALRGLLVEELNRRLRLPA